MPRTPKKQIIKVQGDPITVQDTREEEKEEIKSDIVQRLQEEMLELRKQVAMQMSLQKEFGGEAEVSPAPPPVNLTAEDEEKIEKMADKEVREVLNPLTPLFKFKKVAGGGERISFGGDKWSKTMTSAQMENLKYRLARKIMKDGAILGKDMHIPLDVDLVDKKEVDKSFNYLMKQMKGKWEYDASDGTYNSDDYYFTARQRPKAKELVVDAEPIPEPMKGKTTKVKPSEPIPIPQPVPQPQPKPVAQPQPAQTNTLNTGRITLDPSYQVNMFANTYNPLFDLLRK